MLYHEVEIQRGFEYHNMVPFTFSLATNAEAALVLCTPPLTVRIMLKRQATSNVGRDPTRSAAGRERRKALIQARRDGSLAISARFATGNLGMWRPMALCCCTSIISISSTLGHSRRLQMHLFSIQRLPSSPLRLLSILSDLLLLL